MLYFIFCQDVFEKLLNYISQCVTINTLKKFTNYLLFIAIYGEKNMSEEIKTIAVIEKSIAILEYLTNHPKGVSLSSISHNISINKSTVYRILQTLKLYNYVQQDQTTGYYKLGPRLFIFSSFISNFNLSSFILPYMQEFSDTTEYSTNLAILEENFSITIETYVPPINSSIRIEAEKGFKSNLYCCASGKVFLSAFSDAKLKQYLSDTTLTPLTSHTIIDPNKLKEDIKKVKDRGYAIEKMENEEHIISLAAPIINAHGEVQASLAMMALAQTLSDDKISSLGTHLKRVSKFASQALGANTD